MIETSTKCVKMQNSNAASVPKNKQYKKYQDLVKIYSYTFINNKEFNIRLSK